MPYLFRNLPISPELGEISLKKELASRIGVASDDISALRILKKAVDARRKSSIKLIYTLLFDLTNPGILTDSSSLELYDLPPAQEFQAISTSEKIVITGAGPAGLFSALRLAEFGITATIIERGEAVEERAKSVAKFWSDGVLNCSSNVQFGEGGAGAFSDGKLTCRTNDPNSGWILEKLAQFGAPEDILYQSKPHVGTDILRKILVNIRCYLIAQGFEVYFNRKLTAINAPTGKLNSIVLDDSDDLPCDRLILAIGHSARDTYQMIYEHGILMEQKPFAIGVRVEHPQQLIDEIQYGKNRHHSLPAADYALTHNNRNTGRSAYSFCMCPGGVVIAGSSEEAGVVTNGMSFHGRNSGYANSALVVGVKPTDFGAPDPMAGVRFQRHWENMAFVAAGSSYKAPAQNILSFIEKERRGINHFSYRPGTIETDLTTTLPGFVAQTLREAIPEFDKKMKGFLSASGSLTGVETRTSAPLRILRGDNFQSPSVAGLYPAGEGAGYAGGIMSAAADGVKIADYIAADLSNQQ